MSMKRCPFCGAPNPPDATFCVNCGAKLPSEQPQPYTAPPPPPPPSSPPLSQPPIQPPTQPDSYSRPMSNALPQVPPQIPPPSPAAPAPPPVQPMQQPYPTIPQGQIILKEKDAGIAAVLSLIIPGLGQMYIGKIGRGVLILLFTALLSMILVGFIIWIWNIFDAYNLAKKYNETLRATGRKPW